MAAIFVSPYLRCIALLGGRGRRQLLLAGIAALLMLIFLWSGITLGQEQANSQSYWQFAASGRLDRVVTADVNGDGIDEFIVLDEIGRLTLLQADGQQEWVYANPDPVAAVGTVDALDKLSPELEIVLAGSGYLTLLDETGNVVWQVVLDTPIAPVAVEPYDFQADGEEDILVLLANGELLAFDAGGENIWRFAGQNSLNTIVNPQMIISDFDADGIDEIVIGMFTPRRFSELIFLDGQTIKWQQAISRRITALAEAPFGEGGSFIAVGTNFGQLDLYSPSGELIWFRTLNRPITSMSYADLPEEPAIVVGTASGSVVSFSEDGRRLWTNNLAKDANRSVLGILPANSRTVAAQIPLAVILEPVTGSNELADILLLGNNGQTLSKVNDTDLPELARLTDVNHDGHYELVVARFATLQLFGLGVGDSEYVQEWQYALNAAPTAILVADLNGDGEEDLVIGTRDGRLHSLGVDSTIRWLNAPGEEIAFLERVRHSLNAPPHVAVVRREQQADIILEEEEPSISWLELREGSGERIWEVTVPERVTALAVDDRLGSTEPTVIAGTQDGQLVAYDLDGHKLWETAVTDLQGGIRQLAIIPDDTQDASSVLTIGQSEIVRIDPLMSGAAITPFISFDSEIVDVFPVNQPRGVELTVSLIVFTSDGLVHGLNRRGVEMSHWGWPFTLEGRPSVIESAGAGAVEAFQENATAFLVAMESGQLKQLSVINNQPLIMWEIDNLGLIQAINWDDLDKDGRPDTSLVGTRDEGVRLYEGLQTRSPKPVLDLPLASNVFDLSLLKRASSQSPNLLAITQNGLIRLFREEENRPPLLSQPQVDAEQGQYSIGVFVSDVENDTVTVQLELLNETTGMWEPQPEQRLTTGSGQLYWPSVIVPEGSRRVNYRFRFNDGFYRGYVTPPTGPEVVVRPPADDSLMVMVGSFGLLFVTGLVIYWRQSQTPAAQANQFYKRLNQDPTHVLPRLEKQYAAVNGSPDFLLQLANRARRTGDLNVANLADGLFLLANRAQAGLPIITRVLDDAALSDKEWKGLQQRRMIYKTCQALLEAPSITELGLLRPQFVHVLTVLEERKEWSPILESILPVLTNMRDSERVDSVDDRLVYLNQAAVRLRQVQDHLNEYSPSVERTLIRAITRRWSGLLTAEIEEQRGRAELEVSLKTKRLAPNGQTHVAMEIRNTGRAPAENIVAVLEENPAYLVRTEPQVIPFLPSGRSRQVRFVIEPQAEERFRVGLSLRFDDRNRHDKTAAFGDMVYLLPPVREFTPIANPYLPGTPLRKESSLFFGREELFDFIAEHAGMQNQRNVFMLVGQRRTGKTSLLLRLEDYLPSHLLPVYIDCQSLGVSPGMPALLQEFAWHIADALNDRGITIDVPDFARWQADPTRVFQREFLPAARNLLAVGTILLLVFDEFEAFESMVADGILPRTFFPYMRHLMQHSMGLGFVFVGTRRLEEMSADYWSVLFNIALYRKIDFLSEESATRLICEPVIPNIIYDDLAIDKILRVTAGHPYFLQLMCYTLVKQANQNKTGYVTISDVNMALDEMLRLGEVHFAYIWQRANLAERAVLAAAAHLMDRNEPLHPEAFIEYLQSYSIELDPAEVTHALNALVERDIMREVTEEGKALYELRIGLVGEWVAKNKSLSRLHMHLES